MRVYDAIASVVKSGGKTRRAAKMQTLKCWHPDILEFIECKTNEEQKAQALIRAGYEANFNGAAYSSVMFQNANLSVRCSDAFLRAAEADSDWTTRAVTTGRPMHTYKAKMLLDKIAEGTWLCGDPGVQYEDTIQRWHTCPNTAPINSSNPCSEYMFIDDSACNLASINLMKFVREDGGFDVERFRAAVRVFITAQEILVDHASYPTDRIAANSHKFRPLGLGYANLGSLLMASGLPYDSDQGRGLAGAITAIMHGQAYLTSAEHAAHVGAFDGFAVNREPMLRVMEMHRDAVESIDPSAPADLLEAARSVWAECLEMGREHGYRNSQVTVLAPTGTIAFMMDCDTTGIEPDIALVKYKQLAGGGMLKIVNRTVPMALHKLGYDEPEIRGILDYIDAHDTIEGAPGLKDGGPAGLRLRVRPAAGGPEHPLPGPPEDDGGGAAVPLRRDLQDLQRPPRGDRGGDPRGVPRGLEAGAQGAGDLPRRFQGESTREHQVGVVQGVGRPGRASAPMAAVPAAPATAPASSDESVVTRAHGPRTPAEPRRTRTGIGTGIGAIARRPAAPRAAAAHPAQPDAQVRHPGPRGLHQRRVLPRRPARRAVHHDGQGGFDDRRADGRPGDGDLDRPAIRGAAGGLRQQVRAQPVRAGGVHQEPGHPDRQEHRRLHLPVAGHGVHPRLPRGERAEAAGAGARAGIDAGDAGPQGQRPPVRDDRRPGARRGRHGRLPATSRPNRRSRAAS